MKIKKLLISFGAILSIFPLVAQERMGKRATLLEDGTITTTDIVLPAQEKNRVAADLLFSFGKPANQGIKNSRGVTLADLNGDGVDEILYGIDTTLFALNGDGTIFFEKPVEGPILLPPSIADLDDDGTPEIIFNTGYPTTVGRVYVMDNTGEPLPGWPVNFNDKWMINAPAIADVDGDGTLDIVTGERFGSTQGFVHALNIDGNEINAGWPVSLPATPAFTPSIGDIDNDGDMDVVIAASSAGMYAFDSSGAILPGFPLVDATKRYSYQSPMLVDLDGNETLEIIGANHGDSPGFYVLNSDATYAPGWPIVIDEWTYSTPTVVDLEDDGTFELFFGNRNTSNDGTPLPTIYGQAPDASNLANFPVENYGGNEGVITIADINEDDVPEVIFSSVITDADGMGFLHAYSVDGSGEIDGFPLRTPGFTFLNGAVLGDVDNDGMMDLTANSYKLNFGVTVDSTFVNTFNLNIPYDESKILSNGYKGSNLRDGLLHEALLGISENDINSNLTIAPNPSTGVVQLSVPFDINNAAIKVHSISGKLLFTETANIQKNNPLEYEFNAFTNGIYFITVENGSSSYTAKWIKK
ncbi:hypothetical protein ULMS_27740 [Patiriisocius marinistellae]|uniref:Secretion system C-terminal sorting domain-containing protein n=1 Tax=Patiriisocius marinistellae TaxID=2494560 RepID=A0A5J4G363_9FLAO|nr:T9SS type A sorting domain-containing protein [Patiriisocius marinistellae]GEQ87266.1 hypothetical protein ULMS_27740 [Patiriisocius marinistellae]